MDVLYEFLYLLSLAEILLISFIFGMVVTCRQNQFMESYKTSLRSEKFWKMCLQKHLKISGFLERDHFCQFWIVCPKVIADSSYKIHQNPKQMWISSLFFSVSVPEWQKRSSYGSSIDNFSQKGRGDNCEMLPRPPSTSACNSFCRNLVFLAFFGPFWLFQFTFQNDQSIQSVNVFK